VFTYVLVWSFFNDFDSNSGCTASKGRSIMNNEFERMRKEVVLVNLRYISFA
jgi:hypothetical protein